MAKLRDVAKLRKWVRPQVFSGGVGDWRRATFHRRLSPPAVRFCSGGKLSFRFRSSLVRLFSPHTSTTKTLLPVRCAQDSMIWSRHGRYSFRTLESSFRGGFFDQKQSKFPLASSKTIETVSPQLSRKMCRGFMCSCCVVARVFARVVSDSRFVACTPRN